MLRHTVFFDAMEAVDRSVETREVLPRFKQPVKVEFRRGGEMKSVVDAVKQNRSVDLGAAVGSGKSTKVPMLLAKALGCLVVHTIPFPIAARSLAEYLATTDDGDRVVYMDDLESDMPQHGVVIMSNSFFHARMARDKMAGVSGAVLYLDEIHESDSSTAVLREVAPAMRMFMCVVKATATADPGQTYQPTLPGGRVSKVYPKRAVTTWRADDLGMPWSSAMINGNVLMAIDREEARMNLAAEYRDHGFDVRICLKDTPYAYVEETFRRLKDKNGGIVIMMVDYAYRSSLTIPQLSMVIDSCEVAVPTVDNGHPVIRYRSAYDFEVQQFCARGARLPGESVQVWTSSEPAPKMMCDLETLECDAANLLFRLLGFRPPVRLSTHPFFDGDVPIDIAAAMRSNHPLRLCPPESRVPWVNGHLGLQLEKQKEAFVYDKTVRARAKPVSCHTVLDMDRPVTPPPPVPRAYRQMSVDADSLDAYRRSRTPSPSLDTVYTLESAMPDNLDVLEDGEYAAFARPKRVAKRVLEERAAAAAARAESAVVSPVDSDHSGIGPVVRTVPSFPVQAEQADASAREKEQLVVPERVGTVSKARMNSATKGVGQIYSVMRDKQEQLFTLEHESGDYVYYHDIDKAPDSSNYFLRGVESIFRYCEQPDARIYAKALPADEKLYAMRQLVDTSNNATAVAMGIQRLFAEVSKRPDEDWRSMVDHDDLVATLEWMTTQCTDAQLRVRLCRTVMPLFMKYDLDPIPPALHLEQRVMVQMMEKFEKVAVKRDPDKASEYMQILNQRMINVGPRGSTQRRNAIRFD